MPDSKNQPAPEGTHGQHNGALEVPQDLSELTSVDAVAGEARVDEPETATTGISSEEQVSTSWTAPYMLLLDRQAEELRDSLSHAQSDAERLAHYQAYAQAVQCIVEMWREEDAKRRLEYERMLREAEEYRRRLNETRRQQRQVRQAIREFEAE